MSNANIDWRSQDLVSTIMLWNSILSLVTFYAFVSEAKRNQDLRMRYEKLGFEIASLSVTMTKIPCTT
ncbi:hypothetical protein [Dapis sp. BLCC M229]|uniref:hypothetical protein n=1 Tax=Dapis sp. BLCC M229 TaxID=3400188 RepID=UPI003CE788E6